jgi:hypothetical protein
MAVARKSKAREADLSLGYRSGVPSEERRNRDAVAGVEH